MKFFYAILLGVFLYSVSTEAKSVPQSGLNLTASEENCWNDRPKRYQEDIQRIVKANPDLNPRMVTLGVWAYYWALGKNPDAIENPSVLTLVDFSLPSTQKRLSVIEIQSGKRLFYMPVAHGIMSGRLYAKRFSNIVGSNASSLGCYITDISPYRGAYGESLALLGQEPGLNDNALRRHVVIHPLPYMGDAYRKSHHQAWRSLGCFGIEKKSAHTLVQTLKGGSVLFAYAAEELCDPQFEL